MKRLLAILFIIACSVAQAWTPTKPITVVVPNAPGAGNEIAFRILAAQVEEKTGAKFVYDYRPGAVDTVAMNYFNTLPGDGYHVATPSCQSTYVSAEIWYANSVRFNPMDFVPVTNMGKSPLGFFARTTSDTDTPEKLIAGVKAGQPLNFAVGGAAHRLAVEYLIIKVRPAVDNVQTLMYKGPAQAMNDVLSGQVEFGVFPVAVAAPLIKSGRLKLIGITGEQPVSGL